jgi:hypothetical protein
MIRAALHEDETPDRTARTVGAALACFRDAFESRLRALSEAHDILSKTDWTTCPLQETLHGTFVANS